MPQTRSHLSKMNTLLHTVSIPQKQEARMHELLNKPVTGKHSNQIVSRFPLV